MFFSRRAQLFLFMLSCSAASLLVMSCPKATVKVETHTTEGRRQNTMSTAGDGYPTAEEGRLQGVAQPNAGGAANGLQKLTCLWYPDPTCLHCGRPNLKQGCLFVGYRWISPTRLLPQKREVTAQDQRYVMTSEERMLREARQKTRKVLNTTRMKRERQETLNPMVEGTQPPLGKRAKFEEAGMATAEHATAEKEKDVLREQIKSLKKENDLLMKQIRSLKCKGLTFANSRYKRVFDSTQAPKWHYKIPQSIDALVSAYCTRRSIGDTVRDVFLKDLFNVTSTSTSELDKIREHALRIWTSDKRLQDRELCSILNEAIRNDDVELLPHAMVIVKALNQHLITRHQPRAVDDNMLLYRGAGLPDVHRSFFTVGKVFRVPMFMATSVNRKVAMRFSYNAHTSDCPAVLWTIRFPEDCYHMNLLSVSEKPHEQEYLFTPYSVFTVGKVVWKKKPTVKNPHEVTLLAASDNRTEAEDEPLAPWA